MCTQVHEHRRGLAGTTAQRRESLVVLTLHIFPGTEEPAAPLSRFYPPWKSVRPTTIGRRVARPNLSIRPASAPARSPAQTRRAPVRCGRERRSRYKPFSRLWQRHTLPSPAPLYSVHSQFPCAIDSRDRQRQAPALSMWSWMETPGGQCTWMLSSRAPSQYLRFLPGLWSARILATCKR